LQLSAGEVLALVGKSGSGKTTLVKCIYGLEDIPEGEVKLDGERVLGPAYNLIPGHEHMKLVSQEFYVLDNHTVEENIYDKLTGLPDELKQKRSARLLKLLELLPLRNTKTRFLSSGQKQRVAIARALAVIPKILLLDEPFSNLDKLLSEKLFSFITREVRRYRTAVLLVTHLAEEALKFADNIAIIDNGRIVQTGKKWEVYYKPRNSRLAGLLGDYNIIRKEDLHRASKLSFGSRMFMRPDRLVPGTEKSCDIELSVINCAFNGRCYEILGETPAGNSMLIYGAGALKAGAKHFFKVSDRELPA
jgi:ABC-type Fe3+/spermidine/putrescine transport system ATPase subunit